MALTYNPYSKTSILPAQADIQSIINMFLMMKWMNQMYPDKKTEKSKVETPVPQARGQGPMGGGQGVMQQAPGAMPQGGPQMNPQLVQMLMQMLTQGGRLPGVL